MLVECEKCKSKFNLDESILKEEGSRVKCSICENVFKAYPSGQSSIGEPAPDWKVDEDLEETVALDSPPAIEEMEPEPMDKGIGVDFDRAFEEAITAHMATLSYHEGRKVSWDPKTETII